MENVDVEGLEEEKKAVAALEFHKTKRAAVPAART